MKLYFVILVLISGNVIRNGSIRVDPAWATTALLLTGVGELTGQKQINCSVLHLTSFVCI